MIPTVSKSKENINRDVELEASKVFAHKEGHLHVLDFLRGFAAVSVLLFHFISVDGLVKFHSEVLSPLFIWGNRGVDVFFVISGFVIPYSLWGTGYQVKEFLRYMAKRIIRIAPPAYISLLVILLQWFVVDYFIKHLAISRVQQLTLPGILGNVFFQYSLYDKEIINSVFWTLAIEFKFYVFVGLFYNLLFARGRIAYFLAGFALLTIAYFALHLAPFSLYAYAPTFAIGGATLYFKKNEIGVRQYLLILCGFAIASFFTLGLAYAAFAVGTALVIAFVKIKHAIFAFFGRISYSIYLVHIPVGATVEFLLYKVYQPQSEAGNIAAISICTIITILVAYIFFKLVEIPFVKMGRRLKL